MLFQVVMLRDMAPCNLM